MGLLRRCWERRIRGDPAFHQMYVRLHTDLPGSDGAGHILDQIDRLARACDGRLDQLPRRDGLAVVTDHVPSHRFDEAAFRVAVDELATHYPETYVVRAVERWSVHDGRTCKRYVVVPVRPLFADRPDARSDSPAEPTPTQSTDT